MDSVACLAVSQMRVHLAADPTAIPVAMNRLGLVGAETDRLPIYLKLMEGKWQILSNAFNYKEFQIRIKLEPNRIDIITLKFWHRFEIFVGHFHIDAFRIVTTVLTLCWRPILCGYNNGNNYNLRLKDLAISVSHNENHAIQTKNIKCQSE